ncbi:MAG: HDIG domain-containing protein [Pirellulaceae bacterium]|nr:HDIG domain-containing protein [Pirellulaceae bacterium]
MSGASKQRTRQERIESLGIPKPRFIQWWQGSDKADWAIRVGMALIAALVMLGACQTWKPAFSYRTGSIPHRDVISLVNFENEDTAATDAARMQKRREVPARYRNRPKPLTQLRAALKSQLVLVIGAESYDQLMIHPAEREAFSEFYEGTETAEPGDTPADRFNLLKTVLANDTELKKVDAAVGFLFQNEFQNGLLKSLQHTPEQGSQQQIAVFQAGQPDDVQFVQFDDVQIGLVESRVAKNLSEPFRVQFDGEGTNANDVQVVAKMISDWIVRKLPNYETLQYDDEESEKARIEEANAVNPVMNKYYAGITKLATAGDRITAEQLSLLRLERSALSQHMRLTDQLARVMAYAGMIAAVYLLCGSYIFFVNDRRIVMERGRLGKLLTLLVATIVLGYYAAGDDWRSELIPLVLASIIAAVVYGRDLAMLIMVAACICMTLFLGANISAVVAMAAACLSCILLLNRIRSRTHLLYVGAVSAGVTIATVVGVGIVTGPALTSPGGESLLDPAYQGPLIQDVVASLVSKGLWSGICILGSAAVMTGVLPLVERAFGVQTDLSLLELGDASHPLLRRLAQRAPGTYNHSINVASIGEAAADAIGANGLLVRVGAYFHDIGKMFKPEYFIENQSSGVNQHDTLQPAMSTLVIIAHVKDGADLARSHHLPEPIVDFILQHHGTTLVEYFYREAARRSEEDPNGESVSDKDFRYPGPKPQTLEAAVMMLADTVESASRTLVDPTPARIQGLVDSIAQKKMGDGQFDECGLTFRQLDRVRQSLVKSLTAIYHARVKYPGQQSA